MDKYFLCSVYICLILLSPFSFAKQSTLKNCQEINKKVEHFKLKRRKGGIGSDMEKWKKTLKQQEKLFKAKRCRRYGNKLRKT